MEIGEGVDRAGSLLGGGLNWQHAVSSFKAYMSSDWKDFGGSKMEGHQLGGCNIWAF